MSDKLIRLNPRNSPGCENGFGRSALCCVGLFFITGKEVQSMAEVERVDPEQIDIFENDIDQALAMFCEDQGIDNLRAIPQTVWNAALMYVRKMVFPTPDRLKRHRPLPGYINNNYDNQYSNLNNTDCNAYDIDTVNSVCDYYIYLCNVYNKGVTISGFCYLTGISQYTVYEWGNGNRGLSQSSCDIYKKLSKAYEDSAESKLWANKNPVAVMAILNKRFGWNLPGVSKEQTLKAPITSDKLPDLTQQIEAKD